MEFYIQWYGALQWTHWRSYLKQLICSCLASQFSGKATKVGSPPNFPKLISQLWGIPQPQYFITLSLHTHWTYFWKHYVYMYYKKDTKVGSQILATKFGFVPDCLKTWYKKKPQTQDFISFHWKTWLSLQIYYHTLCTTKLWGSILVSLCPPVCLSIHPAYRIHPLARCLFHRLYSYVAQVQPMRGRCVAYHFQVQVQVTLVVQIFSVRAGVILKDHRSTISSFQVHLNMTDSKHITIENVLSWGFELEAHTHDITTMVIGSGNGLMALCITGLILGLHPANERRRYKVTPSLIGWLQT